MFTLISRSMIYNQIRAESHVNTKLQGFKVCMTAKNKENITII